VKAFRELPVRSQFVRGDLPHPGHDPHVQHHVDAVRQLDADLVEWRAGDAHDERDDVHSAALHRAVEHRPDLAVGFLWIHPVIGGPGILLFAGADEGQVLGAGDVVVCGAVQDTSGQLLLVKLMELSRAEGLLLEPAALLIGAVYPDNTVRLAEGDHLLDPLSGLRVSDHRYGPFYFSVAKSQSGQVARASPGGRCVPLR